MAINTAVHCVGQTFLSAKLRQKRMSAPRAGMTLVEITVTLGIVVVLGVIIAQCVAWSMRERTRMSAHQAALEMADNILEAARAQPWKQLDQAWADAQTIPPTMASLLPDGKVVVKVEAGQPEPQARRVTVRVDWQFETHLPPHSVELTTVLSGRTAKNDGAKP
jgi:type II secretory pathway pseudopilin PulG